MASRIGGHGQSNAIVAGDVAGLLLLSFGWLGPAHLWLTRSHLEVDFPGLCNRIPRNLILAISDCLVIAGVTWILPQIMLTLEIYSGMTMPVLHLSVAPKHNPPTIELCVIGRSALLNPGEDVPDTLLPRRSA